MFEGVGRYKYKLTIIPGDDAWIMSGLNCLTSLIILGLNASESGTFWYHGQGKLNKKKIKKWLV